MNYLISLVVNVDAVVSFSGIFCAKSNSYSKNFNMLIETHFTIYFCNFMIAKNIFI